MYTEAYERIEVGDTRGFIINLAISIETMVRYLTKSLLKEPVNAKYLSLANTISISRILSNWNKIGFNNKAWKNLKTDLKNISILFEERNKIMHNGNNLELTTQEVVKFGLSVSKFLTQGEKTTPYTASHW